VDAVNDAYREKVVSFGEERGLVGVLTWPNGVPGAVAPHVVILNAGILHRVGTNRLHVTLARRLAAIGITTLRFDLSGIGDSERRRDVPSLRESVEMDVTDAIGYMGTVQGERRVVLMGICSGAYDAMHAALDEPRVVGAVLVDIPGPFMGWRHVAHHVAARFFRPASWHNPIKKALGYGRVLLRPLGAPHSPTELTASGQYFAGARSAAPQEQMAAQFAMLLDRSVRLLVVFTAGVETNYNHRTQFRATFPEAAAHPLLTFDYFMEADHAFDRRTERERLLKTVLDWMQREPFSSLYNGGMVGVEEVDRYEIS
jgi:pimeloyl-ACP methyl ester carboxylesterase